MTTFEVIAVISIALSLCSTIGTAYVIKYRVERLESDRDEMREEFRSLVAELRSNTNELGKLTTAIAVWGVRQENVDDHEERIRVIEADGRRCGDCANFHRA